MIYITGDTHNNFIRFTKNKLRRLPFELSKDDYVIVCGDFGLLWAKNDTLEYNLDWMANLPFTLLWVAGNHENYNMIAEYEVEQWHGGKVRHIIRDKIIYLERGQVFDIDGKKFFAFGGASSHDIQGGVFDVDDPDFVKKCVAASNSKLPYRINNITWWAQELPTEEELDEGLANLEKVEYKVDYIISHCLSSAMQDKLETIHGGDNFPKLYKSDILTDYFDFIEEYVEYKKWYCGHYHMNLVLDKKHKIFYDLIMPIDE